MKNSNYYIPEKGIFVSEQILKKSRFIATISQVENKVDAIRFIEYIKNEYADARHNCWAYFIGPPNSPKAVACSDDGEPKGTAGKPILNVIQYKNLSQTIIVVTRYFGGIKLGASGLIRAYSGTANIAINNIKLIKYESKQKVKVNTTYLYINSILKILNQNNIALLDSVYAENIIITFEIKEDEMDKIIKRISDITRGTSLINYY
jgi:uncharacterized YigZ family protein